MVANCVPQDRLVEVVPARGGKLPLFDGTHGKVHRRVRQEMHLILRETEIPKFLDAATALLNEARATYLRLGLAETSIIAFGANVSVFTWQGDWENDTLALMLTKRNLTVTNEGISLNVLGASTDRVIEAFLDIANSPPASGASLAADVKNKIKENGTVSYRKTYSVRTSHLLILL